MRKEGISITDVALAVRSGNVDALKGLVLYNPDLVNTYDERGFPPIVLAAYNDQSEMVQFLLNHGAIIDARDNSGNTALMGVCFKGYLNIAKLLIDAGADVNAQNLNGATALTFACSFNRKEMAELLIGNNADPTLKDSRGNTPADHARMQGLKWVDEFLR